MALRLDAPVAGKYRDHYLHGCPCGFHGDPSRECVCSESTITRYQKKISDTRSGESSSAIRRRVETARAVQINRFDGSSMRTNADMGAKEVQHFCELDAPGDTLMRAAMQQLQLSARNYHRILKLSRTIADLAGETAIQSHHLAEALRYRPKESH